MRRVFLKQSVASLAVLPFFTSTRSYAAPMASSKFVDVDGIRTSYFEGGSGEALVLVHGGGFGSTSFANNWRPIFDHLASHFHVYALDKLGQGYTDNPRNDTDYSMEAVIRHVYRFLETLGIEKVHLVGQSRGGLPVARIAADHPELVENLVIFNSRTLAPDDPSLEAGLLQPQLKLPQQNLLPQPRNPFANPCYPAAPRTAKITSPMLMSRPNTESRCFPSARKQKRR
jgi:pimeloyl-ACP methyl ester carboxylesterase